jgi:hypothetical protein
MSACNDVISEYDYFYMDRCTYVPSHQPHNPKVFHIMQYEANINHLHFEPLEEIQRHLDIDPKLFPNIPIKNKKFRSLRRVKTLIRNNFIMQQNTIEHDTKIASLCKDDKKRIHDFENIGIDEETIKLNRKLINTNKKPRLSLHELKKQIRNKDLEQSNVEKNKKKCLSLHQLKKQIRNRDLEQTNLEKRKKTKRKRIQDHNRNIDLIFETMVEQQYKKKYKMRLFMIVSYAIKLILEKMSYKDT